VVPPSLHQNFKKFWVEAGKHLTSLIAFGTSRLGENESVQVTPSMKRDSGTSYIAVPFGTFRWVAPRGKCFIQGYQSDQTLHVFQGKRLEAAADCQLTQTF